MDKYQFTQLIQETETYLSFEPFKRKLTLANKNIDDLINLYSQAERYGIEYLQQNPRLSSSSIKLINELLNKQ